MAVEITMENYQKQQKITRLIDAKLNRIWQDTCTSSSHQSTLDHPEFKALVEMGPKIIPYIVHLMTHKGAQWTHFMLLGTLTGENPIPDEAAGRFYLHLAYWILWFEKSKYRDHDVYYGLLNEPS